MTSRPGRTTAVAALLVAGLAGLRATDAETTGLALADNARAARRFIRRLRTRENAALAAAKRALAADPARALRLLPDGLDSLRTPRPVAYGRRGLSDGVTLLDPDRVAAVSIGESARAAKDRRNLAALYADLHAAIPSQYLEGLPSPPSLARKSPTTVRRQLAALVARLHGDFVPIHAAITKTAALTAAETFIDPCQLEAGHESIGGSGQTSESPDPSDYALTGLLRNATFALKDRLTCVKDQGRRDTCAAHAIVAAVETHLLLAGGRAEDLSEEHAFCDGKLTTDWDDRYDHGLVPEIVIDAFAQDGYHFQPDSGWNYNRSPQATGGFDPVTHLDAGSCLGYSGEQCTELNFQAQETIVLSDGPTPAIQSIHYDFPAANPASGHTVTGGVKLPPELDLVPGGLLDSVVILLETRPVLLGMAVTHSFRFPDSGGYVHEVPAQASEGRHCVLLVGFVPNALLPAGVPPDPSGHGYFVAKNSWSADWGDEGFGYLSGELLQSRAEGFTYIEGVRD